MPKCIPLVPIPSEQLHRQNNHHPTKNYEILNDTRDLYYPVVLSSGQGVFTFGDKEKPINKTSKSKIS